MINVECPSCRAPYELDERRMPASGVKMRCPKCGTSFHVAADGSAAAAPSPPARPPKHTVVGVGAPGAVPPPRPPSRAPKPKRTMVGIGVPDDAAAPPVLGVDLPAPKSRKIAPPVPSGVDLPAPKSRKIAPPVPSGVDLPAPKASKDFGLDLPAPKASEDFGLDLPAPKASEDFGLDLPAPKASEDFGLDLPAPKASGDFGIDLPAPKAAGDFGLDLPAPKASGDFGIDLPAPKSASIDLDLDLPAPQGSTPFDAWASDSPAGGSGIGDLDLPMPKGQGDLPAPVRGVSDLPMAAGFGDLPAPSAGAADLPMAAGFGDLPAPSAGATDLPVSSRGLDLPVAAGFNLDLPMGTQDRDLPVPAARASLPTLDDSLELEDDLALPEPRRRAHVEDDPLSADGLDSDLDFTQDGRSGAGGVGFGEVDLDLGDTDELEFADLPEEGPGLMPMGAGAPDVARTSRDRISVAEAAEAGQGKPKRRRGLMVFAVLLLLLVAGGAGLKFTPYGLFGMYALERFLPEAGNDAIAVAAITAAEESASTDTYVGVRAGLTKLAFARRTAGLNRRLLARSLVHESLYLVRFGGEPASEARADAIYARLERRGFVAPGIALARAARALQQGQLPTVSSFLAKARREDANDAYVDLIAGEAALARADASAAAEAFASGVEHGGAARAQWGLARALLQGADEGAEAAVDQTLVLSPGHLAARLAKAKLLLAAEHPDQALTFARQAAGLEPVGDETLTGSAPDRAAAFTLVGRIHEDGGRRGQAIRAYDAAISVQPFTVAALLGAGRVLYAERRFRDSLGRFEAAQQAAGADEVLPGSSRPAVAEGKLGAARAMLALERAQDAAQILSALASARPEDAEVLIARGQAEQALDQDDAAELSFRHAIELSPESFAGYLALAQLDFARDDPDAAATVLAGAREHVPETAEVRRMIGESELARDNLAAAIREFRAALGLDAHDTGALFGLAVASRRDGHLADAERNLTRLAEEDASYPGLALERGRLFEARGQAARAVRSYTRALAEHPDDLDLMLRLGAAQVAAGQVDDAEAMLQRVLAARRDSPEAIHFMGRVDYARGDIPQALERFARAVQLDPGRGEYHLWLARVALDRNDLGKANEEVGLALERDSSLGDAYWIRGRTRLRAGMVRDALTDLERALQLSPGRTEAYADRGECYDQLGDRPAAIREYERAIAHDDSRGRWWYRLGRLRVDAGRQAEARAALVHATALGDAQTSAPGWLADAHRILGDLSRGSDRAGALAHYRRYLELAPASAIDRENVAASVARLGG